MDTTIEVSGAFIHDGGEGMRFLRYGDPEIDRLRCLGWTECGLWDGYDAQAQLPCGGPVMRPSSDPTQSEIG